MALPRWLSPALKYVPLWLGHQMRVSEQPGCVLAVAFRGELIFETAFGHANLHTREKLTPRHLFRVASHSKSFTAAAIMRLREQRRLSLDDRVETHVKGLHPAIGSATIAQLLSHTAGIFRDGRDSAYWIGEAPFLSDRALRKALTMPPIIDAGSRFKYSNHGFGLAGLVIEAVAKKPYTAYVAREIVARAGLKETVPDVPLPRGTRLASGHGGRTLLGRRPVFPGSQPTDALASATGFVSTAADLARFFGQLAPSAKTTLLSAASRREMVRPQWKDEFSPLQTSYGLGIASGTLDGWAWFGHSGGFQGYLTRTAVVPSQEISISLLTNAIDGPSHIWLDGVLQILKRFSAEGPPSARTKSWIGRWWTVWGVGDLVPVGDRVLVANPDMANPFLGVPEIKITGPDCGHIAEASGFHSYGEPVYRIRDAKKNVKELRIGSSRAVRESILARRVSSRYVR